MCKNMCVYLRAFIRTYIYIYTHTYTKTCGHPHLHVRIHIHIRSALMLLDPMTVDDGIWGHGCHGVNGNLLRARASLPRSISYKPLSLGSPIRPIRYCEGLFGLLPYEALLGCTLAPLV